jgi:hypothetical protein
MLVMAIDYQGSSGESWLKVYLGVQEGNVDVEGRILWKEVIEDIDRRSSICS